MVADAKVLPPRKASLSRSVAASLARARRRLAQAADAAVTGLLLLVNVKAAGDTSLCLFLAAVWLLVAGVAAVDLGRVLCGGGDDDCALVAAGGRVLCLAGFAMGIFSSPAILVCAHRVTLVQGDSNTGDEEGPAPRGLAVALAEVLGNRTVLLGVLAGLPFLVLRIVGDLQKGFSLAKGSEMSAVGALGKDAIWCFILVPAIALRVWRVTRPDWRCCSAGAVEKNP